MATAGHHGEFILRRRAYLQRFDAPLVVGTPGAQLRTTVVAATAGRHADHTEQHPPLLDQRHADGEFRAAADELLGAVQRIDQPPARSASARSQASSDSTGMLASKACRPSLSRWWAARSAAVTGEASAFSCTCSSLRQWGSIAWPAAWTRSITGAR